MVKKDNEEIYNFLLKEMNYLMKKGNSVRNWRELILLRNEFYKMLEKLNYLTRFIGFFLVVLLIKKKKFLNYLKHL